MVRFVEEQTDEPTWTLKPKNFGRFLPGLHLDMLELKHKLKPEAPIIPDSTYNGDAFTPQEENHPLPDGGALPKQEVEETNFIIEEELESHSKSAADSGGTKSDDEGITAEEEEILNRFADTPQKMHAPDEESESPIEHVREHIQIPSHTEPESVREDPSPVYEEDDEDRYARELVEKRNTLKYLKENNIEFEDTDSLKILRALKNAHEEELNKGQTLTLNRGLLMLMMYGASEGVEWMDPTLKGYLEYQMKLMPMYDEILNEFEDTQFAEIIMSLPPSAKLAGGIGLSSALFVAMKKYDIEDKLAQSKFLETMIPGYGKVVDNITKASRETKENQQEEPKEQKRRKRGPSVPAEDIRKM